MFNSNIDSNLLQKNNTAEVDTSVLKISIISGIGILAAVTSSYFIDLIYKEPSAGNFTLAAVFVCLFIIIFFLQSLFVKSTNFNLLIALGETLGLASFLIFSHYSLILLATIALTYLALYASISKSRSELKNQLVINIHKIAKFSVPKIVTAIVILISVIYSQPFFPENINISKSLIKKIIAPSEVLIKIADNYMKLGIMNFSVDMTIPQLAEGSNMPKEFLQAQFQGMGLTIKEGETILDGVYNFVTEKIKSLNKTVKWAVFVSILLLIFLTIKSFFWMFYWLIYLLIYLFYEILMALGFCKLTYEQISKEIIVL
jgi:hypothetical protein